MDCLESARAKKLASLNLAAWYGIVTCIYTYEIYWWDIKFGGCRCEPPNFPAKRYMLADICGSSV